MRYDYLIVGQGLAGSLLAWRLINAGQRVLVIDNANPCAASRVAAGLVNPVTGKRLVREVNAESHLASARECYTKLAKQFGQTFWHDKPMLRLFDSDEIRRAWQKRSEDKDYQPFIGKSLNGEECGYPQGGFLQNQTAYLSVAVLLDSLRDWFLENACLHLTEFDYSELQQGHDISWRDYHADRIIFCEGARIVNNPWFNILPMQPAQGEILTLFSGDRLPEWIINAGKWLLPMESGIFKLGATYLWPTQEKALDEKTTQAGKDSLLENIPKLAPAINNFQLLAHEVGIRPNSKDKQPLMGFHPDNPRLAVFNGFGSKGSMLIPYYSQHFVDVLQNKSAIQTNVDINRVAT